MTLARLVLLGLAPLLLAGCALFGRSIKKHLIPLEMVRVDGGTFQMGDAFDGDNDDATPVHSVTVSSFSLSRYEVTYAQYDAFARATGRPLPDDDGFGRGQRAVANVSWDEAAAFCDAYGYRLPSEAEWEYAARSGGRRYLYAGTNDRDSLMTYALFYDNSAGLSSHVGRRRPNALGLFDMSGNVAEWVGAYYQFYPEPGSKPTYSDLETSGIRIIRGGSFSHTEDILRTYWRTGTLHDVTTFTVGFRCARSARR